MMVMLKFQRRKMASLNYIFAGCAVPHRRGEPHRGPWWFPALLHIWSTGMIPRAGERLMFALIPAPAKRTGCRYWTVLRRIMPYNLDYISHMVFIGDSKIAISARNTSCSNNYFYESSLSCKNNLSVLCNHEAIEKHGILIINACYWLLKLFWPTQA